ncbi:hypothetical protein [Lysinibacillus xylanilyticus]|uniref:hypothetical protein n=1 Tax=Lysinibacillus xylanilyticus TaxID=582475 RepID=UPI003811FBD5
MGRRDISTNLKKLQDAKRQETLEKIQHAIDEILEDDDIVTKKKLLELTGLSSATFSKPHVLDLLKKNKVCQFRETVKYEKSNDTSEVEQLQKLIINLEKKNALLMSKLQDKDIKISLLREKNEKLENDYSMILGKLHLILKRIDMLDIDIGIDLDEI